MRSLSQAKELLTRLYGVEFPDSLFHLYEFLAGLSAQEWQDYSLALGIEPIGPLQLLFLPEVELQSLKPTVPMVLHGRFYADVPEFFSCLKGDQDWLHWGLLLDEPVKGFRGAASYFSNDLQAMRVYPSLFDAVLGRIEEKTTSWEPDDAAEKADQRAQQVTIRRFAEKLHGFIAARRIHLDDRRGKGFPSDTGLDLLVPEKGEGWFSTILHSFSRWPRSDWSVFPPTGHPHAVHFGEMKEASEIEKLVRGAIAASEKGRALPALSLGRSLWYWKDRTGMANSCHDFARVGFDLLKRAYTLLDRPTLQRVLDVHFEHRDRDCVDLLRS
ncbi:MAG: HPF1 family protein [Gemmataceae bacterium]|nr:HPF1 family protein [Gemmataceae bacterium]